MAHRNLHGAEEYFLKEVYGPQLASSKKVEISMFGKKLSMDYCAINYCSKYPDDIVILVTGFGSGWGGMVLLGYESMMLGHQVSMPSLPGYGNSDNPHHSYYDHEHNDFFCEAEALHQWIQKAHPGKNIHLVGHSMSCPIIVTYAHEHPGRVVSLSLLNPVGFSERSLCDLGVAFAINGIRHGIAFSGNPKWKILERFLLDEKNAFLSDFPDRFKLRWSEANRLCCDCASSKLAWIIRHIPAKCFYAEHDSVANYIISGVQYEELPLYHNTTRYRSDVTAKAISDFIRPYIELEASPV